MAIRIEYLLFMIILLLIASIVTINPQSQNAIVATGKRDVEFKNFSLFEIQAQKDGYEISSMEAIYEDEVIYMHQGVNIVRDDGLRFLTQSLNYNPTTKALKSSDGFVLEFNGTKIQGENLALNMSDKTIFADKIHAEITLAE